MSNDLIKSLEKKIDNAIETIELLKLQVEELEESNSSLKEKISFLQQENSQLNNSNHDWHKSVSNLLIKFDEVESNARENEKITTDE